MSMDLKKLRSDMNLDTESIFVNSAGSSLPATAVNDSITAYLSAESQKGGYAYMAERESSIASFYTSAAALLHCDERNIAFTNSASDGYARALSSIDFKKADIIYTSDDDYVANFIQFFNLRERFGIEIERMPLLENGDLNIEAIQTFISERNPRLVALAHIPTNSGLVQDIHAIGEICKETETLYLVDACQSVGQMEVDLRVLHCDFLSVTGRKFMRGPRGTGLLFVSNRILDSGYYPMGMDGAGASWTAPDEYTMTSSAKRFEYWEKSYALLIGYKEAIDYALDIGLPEIQNRNEALMAQLRGDMAGLPDVNLYDRGSKTSSILTWRKQGKSRAETWEHLQAYNVVCGISERHHAVIDYDKKGIDWVVRFSPHYFNTEIELSRLTEIVDQL